MHGYIAAYKWDSKEVYTIIKSKCIEQGITLEYLNERLGKSSGYLYGMCHRHTYNVLTNDELHIIAAELHSTYEDLFDSHFNPPPTKEEENELSMLLRMVFEPDDGDVMLQ